MWAAATRYQRKERLGAVAKDSAAIFSKKKKIWPSLQTDEVQLCAESAVFQRLNLLYLIRVLLLPSPPPALRYIIHNPAAPRSKLSIKAPLGVNDRSGSRLVLWAERRLSGDTDTLSLVLSRLCFCSEAFSTGFLHTSWNGRGLR